MVAPLAPRSTSSVPFVACSLTVMVPPLASTSDTDNTPTPAPLKLKLPSSLMFAIAVEPPAPFATPPSDTTGSSLTAFSEKLNV